MIKLYGADLSTPSNKVRFALNYLDIPYEYVRVSIKNKENRQEEFLKMNPVGKVPVIDDDGFFLFESDAIIKYLSSKNDFKLYSSEPKKKAVIDQWMDFVSIHLGNALNKVLFNRIFARFAGVPVDEKSISDGMMFLNRYLPVVEKQLASHTYLAGEEMTLADISLLSGLDPVEAGKIEMKRYPKIIDFRNKLKKEEFYAKCHTDYSEKLALVMQRHS